jgi:AAA+ ATPase superfamily predicted ATPase
VDKIGKWWRKEPEIDIVGLERKGERALILEAKWSGLNYSEAKMLLSDLAAKARQIHDIKELVAGITAKKIESKEKIRNEGFIAMDLQDMKDLNRYEKEQTKLALRS